MSSLDISIYKSLSIPNLTDISPRLKTLTVYSTKTFLNILSYKRVCRQRTEHMTVGLAFERRMCFSGSPCHVDWLWIFVTVQKSTPHLYSLYTGNK